tara:strand:+ start:5625 stop:5825 length:201 start_codon:yes stop_codon:yes gene_type:complete
MNNNKQTNISEVRRKNRLFSRLRCIMQIERLSKKTIMTAYDKQQLTYHNQRLAQINVESYMEGLSC